MSDRVSEIRARNEKRKKFQYAGDATLTPTTDDIDYLLSLLDAQPQGGPRGEANTAYNLAEIIELQKELIGTVERERLQKATPWVRSLVNELVQRIYNLRRMTLATAVVTTDCDYRNSTCSAEGFIIGGKWTCNNHAATSSPTPAGSRLCVKCAHESLFSDEGKATCKKPVRTEAAKNKSTAETHADDFTACGCKCVFTASAAQPSPSIADAIAKVREMRDRYRDAMQGRPLSSHSWEEFNARQIALTEALTALESLTPSDVVLVSREDAANAAEAAWTHCTHMGQPEDSRYKYASEKAAELVRKLPAYGDRKDG